MQQIDINFYWDDIELEDTNDCCNLEALEMSNEDNEDNEEL